MGGISRDHWHKRRATGGKKCPIRKKRKFELARPPAMTKLAPQRIHTLRTRGGNKKYRALRLDTGNFAWASEATARKTRIIDVVNNAIVVIDAAPFRQWYESHYAQPLARKKGAKLTDAEEAVLNRKMSKKTTRKYADRQKSGEVEKPLLDQFQTGRVLAAISSRPGQCGRSDGYILEGKELEFYLRKIKSKKGK